MQQDDVFLASEGDAYHQRNREKYAGMIAKDPPLAVLAAAGIRPTCVLEIGCATGFRLAEINERYGAECHGIDPSMQAVVEGRRLYPGISLHRGLLGDMYFTSRSFDLIILSFVLHWGPREKLLTTLAEVGRMLADGGHLVISDFHPSTPTKVAYHHRPGLWTYKARYEDILKATGCYRWVHGMVFDAETLDEGYTTDSRRQAECTLLQKGDFYELCE